MFAAFRNILKVPELRRRVLFTTGLLAVFRLGCHIPTPGIDGQALAKFFEQAKGTLFGLADLFAGGALSNAAIFGLGIMPYISASIIFQLLTAVIPSLERLAKEGDAGRKKIQQYTRYATIVIAMIQGFMISRWLENPEAFNAVIVPNPGWQFRMMATLTLTTGTIFVMWLGEQISDHGIGNGISLIITANIISRMPFAFLRACEMLRNAEIKPFVILFLLVLTVAMTAAVVVLTQAQRRIPVQHARRIVGRKVYSQQSSYIPLRVNHAGMIPVIFASSILMFPETLKRFSNSEILQTIGAWLSWGTPLYSMLYVVLIIFFCYFYTAITFNPVTIADNMKKFGSFIPGVRPGKATSDYFYRIMNRITLAGAIGLAFVAIFPMMVSKGLRIDYLVASFCGGTGTIIVVGVVLDTMKQVESQLLMRHYDGFMKKVKLRGRR